MPALAAGLLVILAVVAGAVFWTQYVKEEPSPPAGASLEQGIALFDQKQYEAALAELQPFADAGTEDWRAHYYLGSTQLMLKDYPAAAAALEQSLALRPDETGTLYALGVAYYRQGNLKLAKAYFGAVLEINPNDEHAKGLMDIMSKLEQNSANPPEQEPAENDS
jgi:tetratricopeptide (TPR) repeat protein